MDKAPIVPHEGVNSGQDDNSSLDKPFTPVLIERTIQQGKTEDDIGGPERVVQYLVKDPVELERQLAYPGTRISNEQGLRDFEEGILKKRAIYDGLVNRIEGSRDSQSKLKAISDMPSDN